MMGSLKQFVILSLNSLDITLLPLEFKEFHLAHPQLFRLFNIDKKWGRYGIWKNRWGPMFFSNILWFGHISFLCFFSLLLCSWSSKSHCRPPLDRVTILMPTHIFVFNHELNNIKPFYMAQHKNKFQIFCVKKHVALLDFVQLCLSFGIGFLWVKWVGFEKPRKRLPNANMRYYLQTPKIRNYIHIEPIPTTNLKIKPSLRLIVCLNPRLGK